MRFACPNDHRYSIFPSPTLSNASAAASQLELPEIAGATPRVVATFWLADPRARSHLNDQLAELLQAFLDERLTREPVPFRFCPVCGVALNEQPATDAWVNALGCSHGHVWGERGGGLGGRISGAPVVLRTEPSLKVAASVAAAWLQDNRRLARQLHDSLRPALRALVARAEP